MLIAPATSKNRSPHSITVLHIRDGEWYPSVGECLVLIKDADYDWWDAHESKLIELANQYATDINKTQAVNGVSLVAYVN